MKSEKSLRIILSGLLLILAGGALHRWFFNPAREASVETVTVTTPEQPLIAPPPRLAVRFQPAPRAAITRTPKPASWLPAAQSQEKLFVEWKGTWYPAEIIAR